MSRKRNNRYSIMIHNEKLLQGPVFSETCKHSFQLLAIVTELALDAGFTSLDAMCESSPHIVKDYCDTACIALRGLKKLEERDKNVFKSLH